ncbi:MAG TPA: UPF0182 family protein [Chitinivibrionales bacterium]
MASTFRTKKIGWWILAIVALGLFMSANTGVTLITDLFWFKELGLSSVFVKSLLAKMVCALASAAVAGIVLYGNLLCAQRISKKPYITMQPVMNMAQAYAIAPLLRFLIPLATLFFAFTVGGWGAGIWETYLKFRAATPFHAVDPLLGKDIGFYVFALPFYRAVFAGAAITVALSFAGSLFMYIVRQHCTVDGRRVVISQGARAHLLTLLGLLIGSGYFFYQFKIYGMVNGSGHIVNGAGYADIHYYIPVLKLMRYVSLVAAALIWCNIRMKTFKFALAGIVFTIAGDLLGKSASQAMQKFIVAPNEVDKETPYIKWSIANTRSAYNLDKIEALHFSPNDNLSLQHLKQNNLTIKNIRLWDQAPLLTTYSQLQEIRTYYQFLDVDNDRYQIGGETRQVMLSPRELVPANLPSRIWINERLSYTHGYGLCLGPVNSVTEEGLPDFFIKNIPPESSTPIAVTRPEIYFGESAAGYAIVNTAAKEFDYPSGNENRYTTYTGSGGVSIGGIFKRLLFVLRFKELKILLSTDISSQSRILYTRQIMDRVNKALPFLTYDSDPYMIITREGRLVWMIDGYTVTDAYPYSAQVSDLGNYIRNSVKVTVDAYNGTLSYYIADPTDPIIGAYARIFPGVFKPLSAMPADLHEHIRYPQTLFAIQARVYSLYHMTDPQVFYNKEDMWKIPESFSEGSTGTMTPYYTVMKLAEVGKSEEFILMVPFTPAKKDNMIAWLAARCDEPNYGKLLVFDFPKQNLVYGPQQIESRINQDPEISKALTLWNQGGSRVIRGSLLVIPVEQSLIYVQPLYIAAQNGGVPELKRVIVAYGNSIAMEETLEKSLSVIFGGTSLPQSAVSTAAAMPAAPQTNDVKGLIAQAGHEFQTGQEALKNGNWAAYGAAMQKVEELLKELGTKTK